MVKHFAALDVSAAEHVRTLKTLTTMKDQAFLKITEMKYEINQFQEDVKKNQTTNEEIQLKNRQNINNIVHTVKEHSKTQRKILSTLENHGLKLNPTGEFSATTPCALTSDVDTYPILRSIGKQSHFSALSRMLEHMMVEGDDRTSIQQFYDAINAGIMTTLSSNKFLPYYVDLPHVFDHHTHLLPDTNHTQYNDALNIYKNMNQT